MSGDAARTDDIEQFDKHLRRVIDSEVKPLAPAAEASQAFPREAIRALGHNGILADRWASLPQGDLEKAVLLAEAMGRMGYAGLATGVSLHVEGVTSILANYARSDPLLERLEACIQGSEVGCIAASETHGGSDLNSIRTILTPIGNDRWRLVGRKKFVSPAPAADFALVLARLEGSSPGPTGTRRATLQRTALVAVDREHMGVGTPYRRAGLHTLATAPVDFDTEVHTDAIVGPPGAGLVVLTHGLTHERLAIAASAVGASQLAIELAATHLRRRSQFGVPLMEHQALRLRLAELKAMTDVIWLAVRATAQSGTRTRRPDIRQIAGLKVTAARTGERVVTECMHLFGGAGYLEDETPLARLWRDSRMARIGAGTDEVMWEIVAGGLKGNDTAYDEMVSIS